MWYCMMSLTNPIQAAVGWSAIQWVPRKRRTKHHTWCVVSKSRPKKGGEMFKTSIVVQLQVLYIYNIYNRNCNGIHRNQVQPRKPWAESFFLLQPLQTVKLTTETHSRGDTQSNELLRTGTWVPNAREIISGKVIGEVIPIIHQNRSAKLYNKNR